VAADRKNLSERRSAYAVRFVVLHHSGIPEPHFDLMIEAAGQQYLHTWRCHQDPLEHYVSFTERIANHRAAYLTYEGPVSGDRGTVTRVRSGTGHVIRTTRRIWVLRFDKASRGRYPGYLFGPAPDFVKRWVFEGWTPFPGHWLENELPPEYLADA
jgi:hypothetical protein